jgi:hypothetical protein
LGVTNRIVISHVVLLPLHERLHIGRRDHADLVTQRSDLTGPVVGAGAGLHRHQATWLAGEKRQQLISSQLLAEDHAAGSIRAMRLKDRLGQVEPDCDNLFHGRLLCSGVLNTSTLAHRCRRGASTPSTRVGFRNWGRARNQTLIAMPDSGRGEGLFGVDVVEKGV